MFGSISSLMESARGSVEELLNNIVDEERAAATARPEVPRREQGGDGGQRTEEQLQQQRQPQQQQQQRQRQQQQRRAATQGVLDPSVSHETYGFIRGLMQDPANAKKLFLSYDKILARRPSTTKFTMTKEQNLHARSIIQAIPEFDKLRFMLAPSYMPDHRFWEVYFTLIWEKHCVGASKGEEFDADPNDESVYSTLPRPETASAPSGARFGVKEEVVTPEDLSKGMKREREDSMENTSDIAGDIAIVSRLLFDGARKTFQMAEQFMEAMDERASASAGGPAAAPTSAGPGAPKTPKSSDAKRGRFEAHVDAQQQPLPVKEDPTQTSKAVAASVTTEDLKHRSDQAKPSRAGGAAAAEASDGAETDGFSVSSMDDADLREWAKVTVSPHSRSSDSTTTKSFLAPVGAEGVEDFEWI